MARLGAGRRRDDRVDLQRAGRARRARTAGASGGVDFAREVIERALGPERAAELLGRIAGPARDARPFEFLRRVPAERIAALLRSESPQTIALVLANLPDGLAAGVLAQAARARRSPTSRCASRAWARPARA